MSATDTASSLFNWEGSEPDAFAAIGNPATDTTQTPGSSSEQQLTEHGQCGSSSQVADMGQDVSTSFAEQMYPSAHDSQHDSLSTLTNTLPSDTASRPQQQEQRSWYSNNARSTGHEPHLVPAAQPVERTPFRNDYDLYRPTPDSMPPSYVPTQTSHALYKPTTTSVTPGVPYHPPGPAPSFVPSDAAQRSSSVASYRLPTPNAYDPPLPPPKANRRTVSVYTGRAASPAVEYSANTTHRQQAMVIPSVPPPPYGQAKHSTPFISAPPLRPPSGPPTQGQPTPPYGVTHRSAPTTDISGHSLSTTSSQKLHISPESQARSGPVWSPPIQSFDSQSSHPPTSLSEVQAVYTSDAMPWDDPEGGLECRHPQTPPPAAQASSPELHPSTGVNSLPASPPGAKKHYRQDTVVQGGQISPKSSSTHSKGSSTGSMVRSPVERVSSPLRNTIHANGHSVYPPPGGTKAIHPYKPTSLHETSPPVPARPLNNQQGLHNPYECVSHNAMASPYNPKLVPTSQSTIPTSSLQSFPSVADPYIPAKTTTAYTTSQTHGRSALNGSTFSSRLDVTQGYNEFGLGFRSYPGEPSSHGSVSAHSINQEVNSSGSRPPYAPSPSLLGSNDPLGRVSARAPVVSFGFGGKLLTCFHGSADLCLGFDVALSTRRTTNITIQEISQLLPEYALDPKAVLYPGPLFPDTGSPVTSLVRSGMSSNVKMKKNQVMKYLEERAEEISRGTVYISDHVEKQRTEGKLILARILKVMVQHDGVLLGSPEVDMAVRTALIPSIADGQGESVRDNSVLLITPALDPSVNGKFSASSLSSTNETPISVTTTLPSSLDRIQEFLVRGEHRQAYLYALSQRLWAHAMIIASSIDKEAWKEVVGEFLKVELGVHDTAGRGLAHRDHTNFQPPTNGREWLRVVYSVFCGQGPLAIQELVPQNLLSGMSGGIQGPLLGSSSTPSLSPNFSSATMSQVPIESLAKWAEIVASVLTNSSDPEWSATLTTLGDHLLSCHYVEAAHVCYLLSPQTSIIGGVGSPSARIVLLGSQNPHTKPTFFRDPDSIIFSEILEFALSLKTTPKGQEPFHGFPHLQAYKVIRAAYLADIGHVHIASRYCEAITASMGRPSPYFTAVMVDQLRVLADRLTGIQSMDTSGSWISGKVNKPSLDGFGSWIEGHLTKFIAGEGDEPSSMTGNQQPAISGPFPTYNSFTSATVSTSPSPPPAMTMSHVTAAHPPRRTGSAMSLPSTHTRAPVNRTSSAMDYYRPSRNASPAPKTAPLQVSYPVPPHPPYMNGHTATGGYVSAYGSDTSSRKSSLEITPEEAPSPSHPLDEQEQPQAPGEWWSALSSPDSAQTPTATMLHNVEGLETSGGGFISLMDSPAFSVTSSPGPEPHRLAPTLEDEEGDDLGLGNNASKSVKNGQEADKESPDTPRQASTTTEVKADSQPAAQAAASKVGSWFNFWKRHETPGPVKANLGEETSFYYDKDLKRWVNKRVGTEAGQPAGPVPPPSRAQTASPTHARRLQVGGLGPPPLARTASAINLTDAVPPPRPLQQEMTSLPNTPAPGASTPPMGRPRSQAARKNLRNRYVDVFQEETSASAA